MIVRSEFSFGTAFGSVDAVLARLPTGGLLLDDTCYGHVPFAKAATKIKKRFALGWRVRVVEEYADKPPGWLDLGIAPRTPSGLRTMYEAARLASANFRYTPRLSRAELARFVGGGAEWLLIGCPGRGGVAPELPEGWPYLRVDWVGLGSYAGSGAPAVASDAFYPAPEDREAWLFACPRARVPGAAPAHILSPDEVEAEGWPAPEAGALLDRLDTPLPRAENIRFGVPDPMVELRAQCEAEMIRRRLDGADYRERLERELALVAEKSFADYFLVIGDMLRWAKRRMIVGPARGSSCGSLVCWLTRITEIDPLAHGLIFERFIDANRFDLPDIDIDFPDATRHEVVEYLRAKYGEANVAHIGTVLRYKPKSALADVAKAMRVPDSDLDSFKDVIIERSSGDSRVNDCLRDSFASLESGRSLLAKHPGMALAMKLEGAAKTSGKHAAGLIVCNAPVSEYCAVGREHVAQIDKYSAEALNMLKIDALGLRTLSVIETALSEAGLDREMLYTLPLDDAAAFDILNNGKYSGIFQFEGLALQQLAREIKFRTFDDMAAIGALARPGPLSSGETHKWIQRHEGRESPTPPHPALAESTKDTLGIIMYQEQVMIATRDLAGFEPKEISAIRKLMSNRTGDESFRRHTERFISGCAARGIDPGEAEKIWKAINTFGSWAFNKSHSVAYGIVSYWCCWLKAHHPLAYALGCLKHARDNDAAIVQLRELQQEGFDFTPFDRERSMADWSIQDGRLVGPLLGVKGIGPITAREIELRRRNDMKLKPSHERLLAAGVSVFSDIFPTRTRWGSLYRNPPEANGRRLRYAATLIEDVNDYDRPHTIVGKLLKKNLRDVNEEKSLAKRGGKRIDGQTKWLMITVQDDTDRMLCMIERWSYEDLGAPIIEKVTLGEWIAVRGRLNKHFRALTVDSIYLLDRDTFLQQTTPEQKAAKLMGETLPPVNATQAAEGSSHVESS